MLDLDGSVVSCTPPTTGIGATSPMGIHDMQKHQDRFMNKFIGIHSWSWSSRRRCRMVIRSTKADDLLFRVGKNCQGTWMNNLDRLATSLLPHDLLLCNALGFSPPDAVHRCLVFCAESQ
jgi:hypothetical protein